MAQLAISATAGRLLAAAAIGGAGAAAGTALWARARGRSSWQERAAGVGFAPGTIGLAAAALGGVAMIVPPWRAAAGRVAAGGLAAAGGMMLGAAAARAAGAGAAHRPFPDARIPQPDPARVSHHVDAVWPNIDQSADNIVMWLPGTGLPHMPKAFSDSIASELSGTTSLVKFPTHASFDAPQGVADTAAAAAQVIRRLDEDRAPNQRILLAGESQGAWTITLLMNDPGLRDAIDGAVVLGHPGFAQQQPGRGGMWDGRLVELTDPMDAVGRPLRGDGEMLADAFGNILDGNLWHLWRAPAAIAMNPAEALLGARSGLRALAGRFEGDAHEYSDYMPEAAGLLSTMSGREGS